MIKWMKESLDLILAILTVALILGAIIGYNLHKNAVAVFWNDGIQIRGDYTHLSVQKNCYLLGFESGKPEVIDKSVFSIDGVIHPYPEKESFGFSGHMELGAYPLTMEETAGTFSATYLENDILLSNQVAELLHPEFPYWYMVWISQSDPQIIAIRIFGDDFSVLAICADSEEQAIAYYNLYNQRFLAVSNGAK